MKMLFSCWFSRQKNRVFAIISCLMYIIFAAYPTTACAEAQDGPMSVLYNWKEAVENYSEKDIMECFYNKEAFDNSGLGAGFIESMFDKTELQVFIDDWTNCSKIVMQHDELALLFCRFLVTGIDTTDQIKTSLNVYCSYYLKLINGEWKFFERAQWQDAYWYVDQLETNTVYVKKSEDVLMVPDIVETHDLFYSTKELSLDYEAGTIYALENTAFADKFARVSGYPVLERNNGDLLITTKNTSQYTLRTVSKIQYCYPAVIKEMYTSGGLYWADSYMPVERPGRNGFVEINGVEVNRYEDLIQLLQPMGITASPLNEFFFSGKVLMSDEPVELTIGYYSGTKFCEEAIHLDHSVYSLGERFTCPVQRTKNGYFVVDTSSLAPGYYVIEDGFNWYTLNFIEITD